MAGSKDPRADWQLYPKRPLAEAEPSADADFVERVRATLAEHSQSYEETMESVTRIAHEWRASATNPRELERLARLIFHTIEPGASWDDSNDEVKALYRSRAESLFDGGYRKVGNEQAAERPSPSSETTPS